jgi:hypothetical protein
VSKKLANRIKLLKYLGDPSNDYPTRREMSTAVLGYTNENTIYKSFTGEELLEIEQEALEIRKKRMTKERAICYGALFSQAKKGNVMAIKEFLERIEGKVPSKVETDQTIHLSSIEVIGVPAIGTGDE